MKINIHEAKTNFSKLIEKAEAGEEIIIARSGKPVAKLTGLGPAKALRQPGSAKHDAIVVADDFDAPLSDDVLRDFHSVNYLLDTHVLLWWIQGESHLSTNVHKALSKSTGSVLVSVASLWEMALKIKLGKLQMPAPFNSYILRQLQINRMEILPIHAPHVLETLELPPHHRDPFDRLLIAQARVEDLTLITRDKSLKPYNVKLFW